MPRVAVPDTSEPAGTLITAMPPLSNIADDIYAPLASATDPVGVGFPLPLLTVTATESDCAAVMLVGVGIAVTVGVVLVPIE